MTLLALRQLIPCCALIQIALASSLSAQHVRKVDQTGAFGAFTDIQPAVDAAQDGDLVLVADGNYAGFEVDGKSLRVMADSGATPRVFGLASVENLGPGQAVELHGLQVFGDNDSTFRASLTIRSCQGPVLVQDCTVYPRGYECFGCSFTTPGAPGLEVLGSAAVSVVESTLDAQFRSKTTTGRTPYVLETTDSSVFVFASVLTGAQGIYYDEDSSSGGPYTTAGLKGEVGVLVRGGTLLLSDTVVTGGAGMGAWIIGNCITSGPSCLPAGDGAPAIRLVAGQQAPIVTRVSSSLNPGPGGAGASGGCFGATITCAGGSASSSTAEIQSGAITTGGIWRRTYRSTPLVRAGETKLSEFFGLPGDLVWLAFSTGPANVVYDAALLGAIYPGNPFQVRAIGVLPASGQTTRSFTYSTAIGLFVPLYEQAFFYGLTGIPGVGGSGFVGSNPRLVALLEG